MSSASITFSNGNTICLHEDDLLTPIVAMNENNERFASTSKPVTLYSHIHDGLIPSIMDALCFCDFFYVNENHAIAYSKNAIVKIESD